MLSRTVLAISIALAAPALAATSDSAPDLRPTSSEPGCSIAALALDGTVAIDWRCVEAEAARGAAFAKVLKSVRDGTARTK